MSWWWDACQAQSEQQGGPSDSEILGAFSKVNLSYLVERYGAILKGSEYGCVSRSPKHPLWKWLIVIGNQRILRPVLQFETSPKGQNHALLQDHKFSPEKTRAVNLGWKILTLRNDILHPIKRLRWITSYAWIWMNLMHSSGYMIGPFNADSL